MKAWYFAHESNELQYGDGREIKIGETHTVDCVPQCCQQGLHGSIKLIDALCCYANGPIIYRVDIKDKIDKQDDKICGQSRTYLYGGVNVEEELHEFARWCALQVVHLWSPDAIVVQYLKTGYKKLRHSAMISSANSIHCAASFAATQASCRGDIWDIARVVACLVASVGVESVDWNKQNRKLTQLINKAIRSRM